MIVPSLIITNYVMKKSGGPNDGLGYKTTLSVAKFSILTVTVPFAMSRLSGF